MGSYGLTDEVRELRARMKDFVEHEVVKAEPALHHGFDGPMDVPAHAEATALMGDLKAEASGAGCGRSATRPRSAAAGCTS